MTAVPARVAAAPSVDWRQAVLAVLVWLPYGLGWLAGAAVQALGWTLTAVRVGWQDGRAIGRPVDDKREVQPWAASKS